MAWGKRVQHATGRESAMVKKTDLVAATKIVIRDYCDYFETGQHVARQLLDSFDKANTTIPEELRRGLETHAHSSLFLDFLKGYSTQLASLDPREARDAAMSFTHAAMVMVASCTHYPLMGQLEDFQSSTACTESTRETVAHSIKMLDTAQSDIIASLGIMEQHLQGITSRA